MSRRTIFLRSFYICDFIFWNYGRVGQITICHVDRTRHFNMHFQFSFPHDQSRNLSSPNLTGNGRNGKMALNLRHKQTGKTDKSSFTQSPMSNPNSNLNKEQSKSNLICYFLRLPNRRMHNPNVESEPAGKLRDSDGHLRQLRLGQHRQCGLGELRQYGLGQFRHIRPRKLSRPGYFREDDEFQLPLCYNSPVDKQQASKPRESSVMP